MLVFLGFSFVAWCLDCLRWRCMDGDHHSLVPVPPESAVADPVRPVIFRTTLPGDEVDEATLLRQLCRVLVLLLLLAVRVIRMLRLERIQLRQQAHYWEAQHERAVAREVELNQQISMLRAEIREWNQRMVGRKSESRAATQPLPDNRRLANPHKKPRGQQRGSKGHGRRNHDHLPVTEEVCDLPEDERCCPDCHEPYEEIPGTADGDILKILVTAFILHYQRKRYRRR